MRLGGFITQTDPIGIAGGLNLYGYAGGDPINFSDPFGLEPDTVEVGLRPLGNPILGTTFGHAAVRVHGAGYDATGELLKSDGTNRIEGRTTSQADLADYTWFRVDVPNGMTSEEFDAAVANAFAVVGSQRRGLDYSPHGNFNSNRFIFDVISRAGGTVPVGVTRTGLAVPGLCGGSPGAFGGLRAGSGCR